jgi:hypothetical protein
MLQTAELGLPLGSGVRNRTERSRSFRYLAVPQEVPAELDIEYGRFRVLNAKYRVRGGRKVNFQQADRCS